MQNGNISNVTQPRVILVFEGALGWISDSDISEFNALASQGKWLEAWRVWEMNDLMAAQIWRVVRTKFIQVDIATLFVPEEHGESAASGLQAWADERGLPVSAVHAWPPKRLARELAYMPDIAMVYDANPETWAMYGRKGHALRNVNDFCRF